MRWWLLWEINGYLYSDIEQNYLQMKAQGEKVDENSKCAILENLLIQKLLLNQSEIDSLEVTDSQVDQELDSPYEIFYQCNRFRGKT